MSNREESEEVNRQLDEAIRKYVTLNVTDKGMVSDWVIAVGVLAYDKDGDMIDTVEPILPDGGRFTPRYRTLGLLKDLTVQYDAVAGHVTIASLHASMDDEEEE